MRFTAVLLFVASVSGCANQGDIAGGELPPASIDGKADSVDGKVRLYKLDRVQGWLGRSAEHATISMSEVTTKTSLGLQAEGTAWGFSAAHPTSEIVVTAGEDTYPRNAYYDVGVIGFHRPQSSTRWLPINCQLDGKTYNVANEIDVFPGSNKLKLVPFYGSTAVSLDAQSCGMTTGAAEDFAFLPYVYNSDYQDIIGGQYSYVIEPHCGDHAEDLPDVCPYSGEDF